MDYRTFYKKFQVSKPEILFIINLYGVKRKGRYNTRLMDPGNHTELQSFF